jgi:hypothetical protein
VRSRPDVHDDRTLQHRHADVRALADHRRLDTGETIEDQSAVTGIDYERDSAEGRSA